MTKEMRPAHRIDILSSALVYYGIKTKEKLGNIACDYFQSYFLFLLGHLLLIRWERAMKVRAMAEDSLHELMPDFNQGTINTKLSSVIN